MAVPISALQQAINLRNNNFILGIKIYLTILELKQNKRHYE